MTLNVTDLPRLVVGSNTTPGDPRKCAMNWISMVDGTGTITDRPKSVHPLLASVVIGLNDRFCAHLTTERVTPPPAKLGLSPGGFLPKGLDRPSQFLCPSCSGVVLGQAVRTMGTGAPLTEGRLRDVDLPLICWAVTKAEMPGAQGVVDAINRWRLNGKVSFVDFPNRDQVGHFDAMLLEDCRMLLSLLSRSDNDIPARHRPSRILEAAAGVMGKAYQCYTCKPMEIAHPLVMSTGTPMALQIATLAALDRPLMLEFTTGLINEYYRITGVDWVEPAADVRELALSRV